LARCPCIIEIRGGHERAGGAAHEEVVSSHVAGTARKKANVDAAVGSAGRHRHAARGREQRVGLDGADLLAVARADATVHWWVLGDESCNQRESEKGCVKLHVPITSWLGAGEARPV